jgi:hypothetical protein
MEDTLHPQLPDAGRTRNKPFSRQTVRLRLQPLARRVKPHAWRGNNLRPCGPFARIGDPKEIPRRADSEVPLENVYSDWPVSTDPAVHIKVIAELFDGGATIVNIHTGQADQKRVIEFAAKKFCPE